MDFLYFPQNICSTLSKLPRRNETIITDLVCFSNNRNSAQVTVEIFKMLTMEMKLKAKKCKIWAYYMEPSANTGFQGSKCVQEKNSDREEMNKSII